jgi:diguanylate cyclase (GGDEF)-like protein/PAS domain S-box-containing protein
LSFHLTAYAFANALAGVIELLIAIVAWRRRSLPCSVALSLMMLAGMVWSFGAALEHASYGIPAKILWSKVEYLGTLTVPILYLLFSFEYNRLDDWLTPKRVALLFTVPSITFLVTLTNEWHGLVWPTFTPSSRDPNIIVFGHGPVYYIGALGYSYVALFVGTTLMIWAGVRFNDLYRRQTVSLMIGSLIPWAANIAYNMGYSPTPGLEITPLALAFTGMCFAAGIYFFRLLDLTPVARETLIEKMSEGVLVLDRQNRVIDINPAGRRLVASTAVAGGALKQGEMLDQWPELLENIRDVIEHRSEIVVRGSSNRYVDVSVSPIRNRQGDMTGRLIVLTDITARKAAELEVQRVNAEMRDRLVQIEKLQEELREQNVRDPLTGLYNRRYMDERLESELVRAVRDGSFASIVMLDIDHFKDLNDTYGHKAGDEVLRAFGRLLDSQIRQYDTAFRYGGEEFLVIMPKTPALVALGRAEEWRCAFEESVVDYGGDRIRATMSAGVATFPDNGKTLDDILQAGDKALYAAKSLGRNCVCAAPSPYPAIEAPRE